MEKIVVNLISARPLSLYDCWPINNTSLQGTPDPCNGSGYLFLKLDKKIYKF